MSVPISDNPDLLLAKIPGWRRAIYAVIGILISLTGLLLIAELACRFLPVNEGLRSQAVNAASPVYRFEPNRTSTWSRGWNFSITNRVHVNNDGFVSDKDYSVDGPRPLAAIVGDSYIEAAMVPYSNTVQGRLATTVGEQGRIYSFAASGAGFSQYLVWAEYARDRYRPDMFVFLNISNDFSESLYHRERSPGFHHFERMPDDSAVLRRVDYSPTIVRRIFRYSALATYLMINVKIEQVFKLDMASIFSENKRWAANIQREGTPEEYSDYEWVVRTFLDRLPAATGLAPGKIVIVTDGLREAIYSPREKRELAESVWGRMRKYTADQARARGFVVIDMQPLFEHAYRRDGQRFEFPTDSHWNGRAHGILANAIIESELFVGLFGRTK